jgi:hypothetical protein
MVDAVAFEAAVEAAVVDDVSEAFKERIDFDAHFACVRKVKGLLT